MLKTLHKGALLFVAVWSLILMPSAAMAQFSTPSWMLRCETVDPIDGVVDGFVTRPVEGTQLYYTGGGSGPGGCSYQGLNHIFSYVICSFITVINDVLGKVYCGMQGLLENALAAALTLFIAVFGVQLMMGMTHLSAGEILSRMLKIVLIWVFVTESAWGIALLFNFFFSLSVEGVGWVLGVVPPSLSSGGVEYCHDPTSADAPQFMYAFTQMDELICNVVFGPISEADNRVIGFFTAVSLAFPPIFAMAVYWLLINLKILVRAVISFLLGISALAFLIALSPIFLSLMLFRSTLEFFENWLKYMVSFSLQIIIIFACIGLWTVVTLQFIGFFNDIAETIFPYQKAQAVGAPQNPSDSWGICPFTFYAENPAPNKFGPYVRCTNANFNPPYWCEKMPDGNPRNQTLCESQSDQVIAISALPMGEQTPPIARNESGGAISPAAYVFYMVYHLVTLIIIVYAFEALLRDAPRIAVELAGPNYVPPLMTPGYAFNRFGQLISRSGSSRGGGPRLAALGRAGGKAVDSAVNVTQGFRDRMQTMLTRNS